MQMDKSAILPEGNSFDFWERKTEYDRVLYVDGNHPGASDDNDGGMETPLKTIGRAAKLEVTL